MAALKPTLAAYSRISYYRELDGDLAGAVEAMRLAVSAGGGSAEGTAYVQSLLGKPRARSRPLRAPPSAPIARRSRWSPAIRPPRRGSRASMPAAGASRRPSAATGRLVERIPLPEYAIGLAEAEQAAGRVAAARRDYALVEAEARLLRANGVNADVDLALFEANHGDPSQAVKLGRRAWAAAPSVRSADAYSWALYEAGRGSGPRARFSARAMRLGSRDPYFLYHAGMIARRAGDDRRGAPAAGSPGGAEPALQSALRAARPARPGVVAVIGRLTALAASAASLLAVGAAFTASQRDGPSARELHHQPARSGANRRAPGSRPLRPRPGRDPELPADPALRRERERDDRGGRARAAPGLALAEISSGLELSRGRAARGAGRAAGRTAQLSPGPGRAAPDPGRGRLLGRLPSGARPGGAGQPRLLRQDRLARDPGPPGKRDRRHLQRPGHRSHGRPAKLPRRTSSRARPTSARRASRCGRDRARSRRRRASRAATSSEDRALDGFANSLAGGDSHGLLILFLLAAAFGWGACTPSRPGTARRWSPATWSGPAARRGTP